MTLISLFLILSGWSILSENMQGIFHMPQVMGLVIGVVMILSAIGLIFKKSIALKVTRILSIGWMLYSFISIVYLFVRYRVEIDWPPVLILVIYLLIYGGIYVSVRKSEPESQ